MKAFKHILPFLFFVLFLLTCNTNDNYLKNPIISNRHGTPKDSLTFYFPSPVFLDSSFYESANDSFVLNWYSSALYSFKEPLLYNYYLERDLYRFLWLRSFHRPVVISLNKKRNDVWLSYKILNKQPLFYDIRYSNISSWDTLYKEKGYTIEENGPNDKIIRADRKAMIVEDKIIQLAEKEWNHFEQLLDKANYWKIQIEDVQTGADGSEWVIEAHLKNKYRFVKRWTPNGSFRVAGEYLIKLSGLKEEIF